ncbi:MAG: hypothetical protein ACF8OB_07265 [Phycisphaeraceae bacterium JB051]
MRIKSRFSKKRKPSVFKFTRTTHSMTITQSHRDWIGFGFGLYFVIGIVIFITLIYNRVLNTYLQEGLSLRMWVGMSLFVLISWFVFRMMLLNLLGRESLTIDSEQIRHKFFTGMQTRHQQMPLLALQIITYMPHVKNADEQSETLETQTMLVLGDWQMNHLIVFGRLDQSADTYEQINELIETVHQYVIQISPDSSEQITCNRAPETSDDDKPSTRQDVIWMCIGVLFFLVLTIFIGGCAWIYGDGLGARLHAMTPVVAFKLWLLVFAWFMTVCFGIGTVIFAYVAWKIFRELRSNTMSQ